MRAAIIFVIISYAVYKFFRFLFGGISSVKSGYNEEPGKENPNVHRSQNPKRGSKDGKNYQGGEYVDYEEVD